MGVRKITVEQEKEICYKYLTHSSSELAKEYGCSDVNIRRIWRVNGLSGKDRRMYYCDFDYFESIDTEDKAYFLGFIAADGCIFAGNAVQQGMLKISIHKQDVDVLRKFRKYINANNPIHNIADNQVAFKISSSKIFSDLQKWGVTERKSLTYIPTMLPEPFMKHFLRGFFDGDGTLHCEAKAKPDLPSSYGIGITTNLQTTEFIRDYLNEHSIGTQDIKYEKRSDTKGKNTYDLRIFNILDMYRFLEHIYGEATVYLDRKYKKYLIYKKVFETKRRPLKKINKELGI